MNNLWYAKLNKNPLVAKYSPFAAVRAGHGAAFTVCEFRGVLHGFAQKAKNQRIKWFWNAFVSCCESETWKGKKYKPCILKYKALILKYVPCIFCDKPCVFSRIPKCLHFASFFVFSGRRIRNKMLRGAKPSECYQKHVSCGNAGKRNVPHDNGFVSCDTGPKMCNNDNEQVPWGTCFCVIGCSG